MFVENNGLIDYFQQRNAINVLRALHHIDNPHWSLVKSFSIQKLGVSSLSDVCYRKLCQQLVALGLAESVARDAVKKDYRLTRQGHETAEIIEEAIIRIEKWRSRAQREPGKETRAV
jgi:DNA-binding HxlR family transcriptional regulator